MKIQCVQPTVSVIIPTWNRKDMLKRAIENVLAQEGVSLEVLVCGDGSTDGSVEMVESWQDPRVRLISGPRAGRPAIPRN
jgi:glycosyltransferase involved in cell wall biosynthesis